MSPAEHDVAGRLHEPLPGGHPLALVGVLAGADVLGEHGGVGFLDLQQQRVRTVAAEHEQDPAAGAHAADTDDLAGHVHELELLEQGAPVGFQGLRVQVDRFGDLRGEPVPVGVVEQVVDPLEQRRVGHDLAAAGHHSGEFLEGLQAVAALRLGHGGRQLLAFGLGQVVGEVGLDAGHVGLGVPDGEVAQGREVAHRAAVGGHGGPHDGGAFLAGEPVLPAGDDQAGRQPFDVPFPRAGQRLVEVVDVEHQVAFGRGEQPEVEHVRVPAQLRPDPGLRGRGQVAGHDGRRAAVEPER